MSTGSHHSGTSSWKEDSEESNAGNQVPTNETLPRLVGKLYVSASEIGRGNNGTSVFKGQLGGWRVAVKMFHHEHRSTANKLIRNLVESDIHPNVVRLRGVEEDEHFIYISLDRCACNLGSLIQKYASSSSRETSAEIEDDLGNINLWGENGLPSSSLLNLMRDIVSGLAYLHELGIIHGNLKPENVVIKKGGRLVAKLSDMGMIRPAANNVPLDLATEYRRFGWQAPEQLCHEHQTCSDDLFSLGCIIFFCITKGEHPFANVFQQGSNIFHNQMDLFSVDHIPEAIHLISHLLKPEPELRPSAKEVYCHPLFWNSATRLSFLEDVSYRVESEVGKNESKLLEDLENTASIVYVGRWDDKLNAEFISDLDHCRNYKFDCVRDLLRVIRITCSDYILLPKELQETIGRFPEGLDVYFRNRFPKLIIEVHKVISRYCREEDSFAIYYRTDHILSD